MAQFKIPVSVLVIIYTPTLEVLLMERADRPDFWQSVTGSQNHETETLQQTAIREVNEETGLNALNYPLTNWHIQNYYQIYEYRHHLYSPGVTHNTEHVFGLALPQPIEIRLAPLEHIRYAWLPWKEAAEKCFSETNRQAILMLPEKIAKQRDR